MDRLERLGLLPHEPVFGLFLALTAARLVAASGPFTAPGATYLLLILSGVALLAACRASPTPGRWRLRLLFFPVAMNVCFFGMGPAVALIHDGREDGLLQGIDRLVIGGDLSLKIEPWVTPARTEALSLCYILFFPYLTFSLVYYLCGPLETLKRFFAGLFTIYGVGFIGYTFVPAVGPYQAHAGAFRVPLEGGWITHANAAAVAAGSNGVDVFPSLHCAVSAYLLLFDRVHKRWRFRVYLAPCLGLWISTIYLRYHYLIDVVCGFALCAAAWAIVRIMIRRKGASREVPGPV